MRNGAKIAVIIPALNEEQSIGRVVSALPRWVDDVIVVDNGSTDRTAEIARAHGARVVGEPVRGYGMACLSGIAALEDPDIVVFMDGDFSDDPEDMSLLVDPIISGEADLVIGSRTRGQREPGSLTPQARFGNWLACVLIRLFWNITYTDLGPFRAIRASRLKRLGMRDRDYGWTVEMQIKAAREGLRVREVPVSYRRRIGESKVSGTLKGALAAGVKILSTIFLAAVDSRSRRASLRDQVIVFTRYPEPGKTKTRLIPALGPEGAATVQRQMTEHTLARIRELAKKRSVSVEVRYEGGSRRLMRRWLGQDLSYCRQGGGDLGARLNRAFCDAFAAGMERVVIMGADCPGLTGEIIERALAALEQSDVVLGPALDGGYYLIGLRRPIPDLFANVSWGTAEVLEQTRRIINRIGLSSVLLEPLGDVDRPEDLPVWEREVQRLAARGPLLPISIIIPTLNEAASIEATLASLRGASDVEVIIVDGGSRDETVALARSYGAKVLASPPGRARQMNAGAEVAKGEVLLFLHGDTRLPEGFDEWVRQALARPGVVAGAFRLGFDSSGWGVRLIERLANWRSTRWQMPYGDQAIFLRAETFRTLGGFPDIPIMEDFELVRRLRRRGRVVTLPIPIVTSARRWREVGVVKTTLINQAVIIGYLVGLSPARLARWYYGSPPGENRHHQEGENSQPGGRSDEYERKKQWQWPRVGSGQGPCCSC